MIRRLFVVAFVLSIAIAASAQQQVAFLGDNFTAEWQQSAAFNAHSNWLGLGVHADSPWTFTNGLAQCEQALQTIINSGQKPVIFLNVGEMDSERVSPGTKHGMAFANFASQWEEIILTAQQAHLPIIVSTITYSVLGDISAPNNWIITYAQSHNIPYVNFNSGLGGQWYSLNGKAFNHPGNSSLPPVYWAPVPANQSGITVFPLTDAGYALISDMAAVAIGQATGSFTLKTGYLDTIIWNDEDATEGSYEAQNTIDDGGFIQMQAWGIYTDGSIHPINNADQYGKIGTWASSNPVSLFLDPVSGSGQGLDAGTSSVTFVTNTGAKFNEWTMFTVLNEYPCGACVTF